jgi:hypothetical protein
LVDERPSRHPPFRWIAAAVVVAGGVAAALVVLLHRPAPPPRLLVGLDDDSVKWIARPDGPLADYRALGVRAVRLWIPWHGEARPHGVTIVYLDRAEALARRDVRVVLAVFGFARDAPLTARARERYCGFVRASLMRVPDARDVVVWNEANNPTYWPRTAGAALYEPLLARCYDVLHAARRDVNVLDSTSSAHDPGDFVRTLGIAYRASARARPLVDAFGHNPYPVQDGIAQDGYARLLAALRDAFRGTPQPLAPIWYLEDGFQSTVPPPKRRYYRGRENVETLTARAQAEQVWRAILLASCQPRVGAIFNFERVDEDRLAGWQSGLRWRDGTRKPAWDAFRRAARAVRTRQTDCQ